MKIKTLAIVVLSALSLSSAAALADTTRVNGGTVHFKGEVVNAACAVDAGSVDQTVQLGQVRTASLDQDGATSSAVGFNIQLNDCDTDVASKAAVAFLGTTIDTNHTNVLALQSSAAGSATNVGVQILDKTGTALALDGASFSAQTTLNNGTNTIPFQARYYAIGAATLAQLMRMRPSRFSINNLPRFRDVITGRDAHPCAIKITMKRKRLFLLASLLPMFALAGNKWNTTLPGGNMQFQGVIIAEACRIEAGDKQMTVNMGQISSNRFHAVGEDSAPVPFVIHLRECSTVVSERVGVAFHGVADGKNPDVLSVGEGPGIATNIGVALFDDEGNLVPINRPPVNWKRLYSGSTSLHFIAKYRATGRRVTGGIANAQAWFSLTYQ